MNTVLERNNFSFLFVTVFVTFHFDFMPHHQEYLLIKASFCKCQSFGTLYNNSISTSKLTISIKKKKKRKDTPKNLNLFLKTLGNGCDI